MGITHILPLSISTLSYLTLNPSKIPTHFRCLSSPKPNWGPQPDTFRPSGFGFEGRQKRRNWWSDDDADDDDDDVEFGIWDEPNAFDWIFEVFKAFGWMVPAVVMSILMGTGSNSLIMALLLPLGQTALSIMMEKLWGDPRSTPNPEPRSRSRGASRSRSRSRYERNPFVGNANKKARKSRKWRHPMSGSYRSWEAATGSSGKKAGKSASRFGGWDELDEQVGSNTNISTEEQGQQADELRTQHSWATGKLSRRNRDKPLLIRLLIAVFPFLGSWTKFLF